MILTSHSEEWRTIPSQPDLMASSLGRIQLIPHQVKMPRGGFKTVGGVPTFGQWQNDQGRFIYCRRGHKTLRVAPLVCEAFNGPKPSPDLVCLHLDENSKNNVPSNLKWGTQKENLNCPGFLRYCRKRTGKNNPYKKGLSWAAPR